LSPCIRDLYNVIGYSACSNCIPWYSNFINNTQITQARTLHLQVVFWCTCLCSPLFWNMLFQHCLQLRRFAVFKCLDVLRSLASDTSIRSNKKSPNFFWWQVYQICCEKPLFENVHSTNSVAVVERMLKPSLLLFSNKNENNCDGNKSNNRNTARESVLENPSIAQSSLYVAIIIHHFVLAYVNMMQYISTTIRHGAYLLPCHKHQQ